MSRILAVLGVGIIIIAFGLGHVSAQNLREIEARQKVAAEKLIGDVKDALKRSDKLDSADAKYLLNRLLRDVRDSNVLLNSERDSLVQSIQIRIRAVDDRANYKRVTDEQRPLALPPATTRPGGPKFVDTPPAKGGTSTFAKDFIGSAKNAQQIAAAGISAREKVIVEIGNARERDLVPATDGTTFPKNWAQLSAMRKKQLGPQLTPREVALLKALNSTLNIDYNDRLKLVLDSLQERSGIVLFMDEPSVQDVRLDYDDQVNLKFGQMTVRMALKKILGDRGLTYIVKEGSVHVMTPKKASEYTVLRSYPIEDLVGGDPQVMMMFGPFMAQQMMAYNANQLIKLIQTVVEPDYWQPNGPGVITFFPPTKSIFVRASAEVHYQLGSPGLFGR
ncbi:MAG: hypothetical protein EXS16_00525 [Gemmataceae bacterium]|nr:hypothetical protein [Gemmataceae bacterium]